MNEITAFYAPAALAICSILLFATALIIKAWRDGSLKADIKWVRGALRIYLAHVKTTIRHN